ncbi:MAG: DNA repair protein RadC [Clostridia bacterium]|nr:DNA repair protein RadC [Clostridia bacterium]
MAVHDGHRDRMRKRIEIYGIDSLQDHEVLEYLLYSFVPRKDTNELAHNILNEIGGSLSDVFDQSVERLQKIKGVSYNIALFLSSMSGVSRRYASKSIRDVYINNVEKCVALMKPIMSTLTREEIHMLLRDSSGKLIKRVVISKGIVNESVCSIRDIADIALRNEACGVVLVHNHPSNIASPSFSDIQLTEQIYVALTVLGIDFDDHIIITHDSSFSFKNCGLFDQMKNGKVNIVDGRIKDIKY